MFSSRFLTRIGTVAIVLMLALGSVIPAYAVGTNDNFANATQITSLPFSTNADNAGATYEAGESFPSCGYGSTPMSIWYAYTPAANITLTTKATYYYFPPVLAIFTGSLGNLTQVACASYSPQLSFQAQAGVTYYFQLSSYYPWDQGIIPFSLEVTQPPYVSFYYNPYDPNIFDNVWFQASITDPGYIYGNSYVWTMGDGTTSNQSGFYHQFAADGDYPVSLMFTTYDGRSNTANTTVQVRTRDIAINKFNIPQSAKVNTTKAISVDVTNKRYSDNVQVQLFKGLPGGGEQLIGTLTIYVPERAKRPTTFNFSYTFTGSDAAIGKVTFRAVATLVSGRDALPADNTAIGTTLVTGGTSYP
jgi:hypothetical protein